MHRWGWSWLLAVFLLGSGCQQVDEVEAVRQLLRVSDLKKAHDAELLKIMGAIYSVHTGQVRVLQD